MSKSTCAALSRRGAEDHWYFLSYSVDGKGVQDFQIPFTSHPWFSGALKDCAALGFVPKSWVPSNLPGFEKGLQIQSGFFEYIPSVDSLDVTGRLVRLSFPIFGGHDGDLALRVEVNREGEVLGKQLLFTTDAELGQLVLANLEAGLDVEKPGNGLGPFIDILSMKFQAGELVVLLETHHAKPKG